MGLNMSEFNIKTKETAVATTALKGVARSVADIYSDVSNAKRNLGFSFLSSSGIQKNLNGLLSDLTKEKNELGSMSTALDSIIQTYSKADKKAAYLNQVGAVIGIGATVGGKIEKIKWDIPIMPVIIPGLGTVSAVSALQLFRNWWNDESVSHWGIEQSGWSTKDKSYTGGIDISKWKNKDGKYISKLGKKISDFNKKHQRQLIWKDKVGQVKGGAGKYIYDPQKGGWRSVRTKADDKEFNELTDRSVYQGVDVTLAKFGIEKKNQIWRTPEDAIIGNKDGSHLSGEVRVGTFDRDAYAYIGAFGVGASAGVSVSLLHAEGEAQAGNEYLGIYGKGEVDILKAKLSGDASLGFDKNGKFTAHAGAKAEGILAEGSVQGGVKVLGTDVGVKAGVNVGIGAHADFGIKDGKITVDLGASLGVGLSLKIDVDVSGTIDTVCDVAKSVMDKAGDIAQGAGEVIGNIGKGIGDGIGKIGKGIGKLFGW